MRMAISYVRLLDLMNRVAPDLKQQMSDALAAEGDEQVALARGVRRELIRTYRVRRSSLEERGIATDGVDEVLRQLAAHPDEHVWGFGVSDDRHAYVGFVDDGVKELIAILVLPRNVERPGGVGRL
jgi:hypothetical protein